MPATVILINAINFNKCKIKTLYTANDGRIVSHKQVELAERFISAHSSSDRECDHIQVICGN